MNFKELLSPIATKYNVAITYGENSAEITGFFENNERLITKKVNCKIDIEDELDKLGMDYKVISAFNPDRIIVEVKE